MDFSFPKTSEQDGANKGRWGMHLSLSFPTISMFNTRRGFWWQLLESTRRCSKVLNPSTLARSEETRVLTLKRHYKSCQMWPIPPAITLEAPIRHIKFLAMRQRWGQKTEQSCPEHGKRELHSQCNDTNTGNLIPRNEITHVEYPTSGTKTKLVRPKIHEVRRFRN